MGCFHLFQIHGWVSFTLSSIKIGSQLSSPLGVSQNHSQHTAALAVSVHFVSLFFFRRYILPLFNFSLLIFFLFSGYQLFISLAENGLKSVDMLISLLTTLKCLVGFSFIHSRLTIWFCEKSI